MTKAQWKAIYDFCEEYGYYNAREVLDEIKANGTLDNAATFDDLVDLASDDTYDAMWEVLEEELLGI